MIRAVMDNEQGSALQQMSSRADPAYAVTGSQTERGRVPVLFMMVDEPSKRRGCVSDGR